MPISSIAARLATLPRTASSASITCQARVDFVLGRKFGTHGQTSSLYLENSKQFIVPDWKSRCQTALLSSDGDNTEGNRMRELLLYTVYRLGPAGSSSCHMIMGAASINRHWTVPEEESGMRPKPDVLGFGSLEENQWLSARDATF